jgi:hypothetical protein
MPSASFISSHVAPMDISHQSAHLRSCIPHHLLHEWTLPNAQVALAGLAEGIPSTAAWEAIVDALRCWPSPAERAAACDSISAQLQSWPWELRAIPYKRLQQLELLDLIVCVGSLHFEGFEYFGNELLRLADSPASRGLRQLEFFKIEYTGGAFSPLLNSTHLAGLSSLRICNAPFFEPLDKALGGRGIRALQSLTLKGNEIYDEAELLGLLTTPLVQQLSSLTISNPCIGADFLLALTRHPMWPGLAKLDLRGSNVSSEEINILLREWGGFPPKQVFVAHTYAAKSPQAHWAAFGVDWQTAI